MQAIWSTQALCHSRSDSVSIVNTIYFKAIFFSLVLVFIRVLFLLSCRLQAVVILEKVQIFDLRVEANIFKTTFDSLESINKRRTKG